MKMKLTTKQLVAMGLLATVGFSSVAVASGFQLWEESAAGTGDYHAGGAAEANDASTQWYNPAGMVRIKKPEISVGAVFIPLKLKYKGIVNFLGLPNSTNGWVDGSTYNLVPNMHLVYPINSRWVAGFGVSVPFGLSTNYPWTNPASALGATVTKIMAFDFNPNIAYAINSKLSVGAGLDVVYGRATYDNSVLVGTFTNKLHDTALGWDASLLYQLSPRTRFGVSYRSKVTLNAHGESVFTPIGGTSTVSNNLKATLVLPSTTTISVFQTLTPKWDVMASAYYTAWDVFGSLLLQNTALPSIYGGPNLLVHENYHDSWNFALGAHYHISPAMMLKFGVGYDLTPTRVGYRDMRLPDNNRVAIAAGIHAVLSKALSVDFGWTHLFVKDTTVNNTQSGLPITVEGTTRMSADVIGAELSWRFNKL